MCGRPQGKSVQKYRYQKKGGTCMVDMTHQQELNLERFANLMVDLIEKHASAVDKAELENKLNNITSIEDAEKSASSVVLWAA